MSKSLARDNAADRISYVSTIFNFASARTKEYILKSMKKEWADLHNNGYIHIHDLDAYGLTYNCLTFDLLKSFPFKRFSKYDDISKIVCLFSFLQELFEKMGNEQSGGMAIANFDIEISTILAKLNINILKYRKIISSCVKSLIFWCNNLHTRMGKTSYYITFNIGLGTKPSERLLTKILLDEFFTSGDSVYKPNIVFKVKKGINANKKDKNFDLLMKAINVTTKKMIPTFLLCDCESDKKFDPLKLSVMGCRTRVVDDVFGNDGAIGRGNIDNISINLPRLAFESIRESNNVNNALILFKRKWKKIANVAKDILIDRYEKTLSNEITMFPTNCQYQLWLGDINKVGVKETFKHGTLSIGFIGLSETIEILTEKKYWSDKKTYLLALDIVKFMRNYVDKLVKQYNLNFSLLATSGELISGRFVEIDRKRFKSTILEKGFYTNSFHVSVDSLLSADKKLQFEGPFHKFTNGGSISYVELKESPIGNAEGIKILIDIATKNGVRYLGFNFPLDICNKCGTAGTFDICSECNSSDIKRIRRVSGYLEEQSSFVSGKYNESKQRRSNN